MKKLTKILVLLLSVALVCTGLIIAVSADDATFDLAGAISSANDGDTITLTGNATISSDTKIEKNLTIDLGGYTITSKTGSAFSLQTAAVNLKIVGTGKINLGGQLVAMNYAGASFSIEGSSAKDKIEIVHDGSVYKRIFWTGENSDGSVTFKNVSLSTTYHPDGLTASDVYINSLGTVTFSFENFDFYCGVKYTGTIADKNQSFSAIYLLGKYGNGAISIKNSDIDTTGGGIILNGLKAANNSDVIVTVDNSTIRTVSPDGMTRVSTFYAGKEFASTATSKGTIVINNSIIEASYSLFNGGKEEDTQKITVDGVEKTVPKQIYTEPQNIIEVRNSHIAITSVNPNNTEHYSNTRGATVRYYEGSTLAAPGYNLGAVFTGTIDNTTGTLTESAENSGLCFYEGARVSAGSTTNFHKHQYVRFPDGSNASNSTTYDLIFDPVGDPMYPWVVVKLVDGALPEGVKDYSAGFKFDGAVTANNFWYFDFSDCFKKVTDSHRDTYMAGDGAYSSEALPSISNGLFGHFGFEGQGGLYGTFKSAHINGNEALKYVVTPLSTAPDAETRDYSDKDNYFLLGDGSRKGVMKTQTYKVMVFDIDIGTDSGMYPELSELYVEGRYVPSSNTSNSNSVAKMQLAPDGTLTLGSTEKQLSTENWNRLTAVCYMEEGNKGTIHYYLNGEELGTTNAYDVSDATSYLRGFRFRLAKTNQTVGASILFDNYTIRLYSDYLGDSGTASDPTLYNYYTTDVHKTVTDNYSAFAAASVNGKLYGTLTEAAEAAAATGTSVKLENNVTETVNVDAYVLANGYTLNTLDGSAGLITHTDAEGNVYAYTLDKSLSYKVNFVFEYDGTTYGPVSAGVGAVPADLFEGNLPAEKNEKIDGHWKSSVFLGWQYTVNGEAKDASNPIDVDFARDNDGVDFTVTPIYEWQMKYAWVIEAADGTFRLGGESATIAKGGWSSLKFANGETFVVQADTVTFTWFVSVTSKTSEAEEVYNFDLNGHTLISDWRSNDDNAKSYGTFNLGQYDTYNVYSSRPGGYLLDIGNNSKSDYTRYGGDLFRIDKPNAKLNVGDVTLGGTEYKYGENLTVNATAVLRLHGDAVNSEANIKGCTLIRSIGKHGNALNAMIYSLNSEETGDISTTTTVTDAKIIVTVGYLFGSNTEANSKSYYNTTFNNCTIVSANGDLFRNVSSKNTVTFNNCVIHGNIKATGESYGNVIVKDTVSNLNAYAAPEGYVNASWNVPMSLGEGVEALTVHKIKTVSDERNAAVTLGAWTIGIESTTQNTNFKLGSPAVKTVPVDDVVNVTYNGLGGATASVPYAVGGNVVGYKLADYTSTAFTLIHNGNYTEEYAKGVSKEGTYVYNADANCYTGEVSISGLRVNVSLYADFGLNLYIPSKYDGLVTVNGKALTKVLNGTYLKSESIIVECDKASEAVTFTLDVSETVGGKTVSGTATVTLSITDYAEVILDTDNLYAAADKALVYYMLNYSNEANKYFNDGAVDDTVSAILTDYEYITTYYNASSEYDEYIESSGLSSVVDGVSICLSPSPAFVINVREGFKGIVKVTYSSNNITKEFNNFEKEAASTDNCSITVNGMKAYNFGTVLNITVSGTLNGEDVSVEGKYSLDTYVKDSIGKDHFNLAEALRIYSDVSEAYKTGDSKGKINDYGNMIVEAPELIYTNYSGGEFKVTFTNSDYTAEPVITTSDSRVTVENGMIFAKGTFDADTEVTVTVTTPNHKVVKTVKVSTYSKNFIEKHCLDYEAEGGTLSKVGENATIFVGDSYFTEYYWEDFYTDYAGENTYLLGIGGSKVDEWFMCSERLVYPLNPSEIIVHIGFNDIYNESPYTPAEIGERIIALLTLYHEKLPNAKVYYCSIECSLYVDSFKGTVVINEAVSAFAAENSDWLTFVNTRPIFCNEETQEIYKDKYGVDKGSHPAVETYDEYKEYVDAARGKTTDESEG
ncbi:MAG: hypothetical protein IJY23_07350 [Clostridia bacterium]|nr:hypothetical protein [Clostridia bacterium]